MPIANPCSRPVKTVNNYVTTNCTNINGFVERSFSKFFMGYLNMFLHTLLISHLIAFVSNSQDDYEGIMLTGKEVINEREEEPQYMFLGQRLQALEQGWDELQMMWAKQNKLLSQAKDYQAFVRDCKQVSDEK